MDPLLLALHGLHFSLEPTSEPLRRSLERVVAYVGVPVMESSGGPAALRLRLTAGPLPPEPATEATVAHEGGYLRVWLDEGRVLLRTAHAAFYVDPASGTARGVADFGTVDDSAQDRELAVGFLFLTFLLLRRHRLFPLHAAALVHDGVGVLFAGASDSGKSTTAYTLVRQGWTYLSDDSVLLRPSAAGIETLSFRRNFGLDYDARERFPEIAAHWATQLSDAEKRSVPMEALYPGQAATRCIPRLLIFPEIVARPASRLEPVTRSTAFVKLAAQSALLTLRPDWTPEHLDVLKRLVAQAPEYRLLAGRDLLEDPGRIVRLLGEVWPESTSVPR